MNQITFIILLSVFHLSCSDIEFDLFDPKKANHESKIDIQLEEELLESERQAQMELPLNKEITKNVNNHENQNIELITPRVEEPQALESDKIEDKESDKVRRAPSFQHEIIQKEEDVQIVAIKMEEKKLEVPSTEHSLKAKVEEKKTMSSDQEIDFQEVYFEPENPIEQVEITPEKNSVKKVKNLSLKKKDLSPKKEDLIEKDPVMPEEKKEIVIQEEDLLDIVEEKKEIVQKEVFSEIEDAFIQESFTDPIDIVFVLDKSSSMENERKKLRRKMTEFFNSLEGMDWRLSVISSDSITDKGSFMPFSNGKTYITSKTMDYKLRFFELLEDFVSFKGVKSFFTSSLERPIEAAMMTVNQKVNKSFFRKDAKLVFVMLTNENENGRKDKKDFFYRMKQRFSDEKEIFVYSFIILPNDFSCLKKQHTNLMNERMSELPKDKFGKKLYELSLQFGKSYDICSKDYGDFLKDLVIQSTYVRQKHFKLTYKVSEDKKIEVITHPVQNDLEWRLEENLIIFNKAPKAGSIIKVRYYSPESGQN